MATRRTPYDREKRRKLANSNKPRQWSNRLRRGEKIVNKSAHHQGMAELKSQLGDPRPEEMTLSLVNYWSIDSYWGHHGRKRYRLSINPEDYI